MRATQQIKKDWLEVIGIMDQVRDRQSQFLANIQELTKNVCESGRLRLGNPPMPAEEMRLYVDTVDALATKLAKTREVAKKEAEAIMEEWDLNGQEIISVSDDEPTKDGIAFLKKLMKDVMKENRRILSSDKEDMKKNVRSLTDCLKETITSTLSVGVFPQKVVDQQVSASTENRESVRELSLKMLGIEESLKRADFDVSSIKGILDTIDGHLDEIYVKLDLDKKTMSKQCRDSLAKMAGIVEGVDKQAALLEETGGALARAVQGMQSGAYEEGLLQVREVSAVVQRFSGKVEAPMKMLVCNMRFLYESTLNRGGSKGERPQERGDVPPEAEGVKIAEENIGSLMKDFRMRTRSRKVLPRPSSALDFATKQSPHFMRHSVSMEMRGKTRLL